MNLSHTVKVVGSVVLSAVMAGSMMPVTVFAQNNDENPTEKTETVYSVLNSDGSISDTIVSSWLHDEDGINNIKETLNLTDVKNIKSNEKPSKDGNTYTWNAKGNDVYYEGTGTKQLPVSVKLRYELDGQEMSAKDMEGKSGHLKLTISFTNNYSEVKNINGKSIVIHPSYLAGGMLNMSTGNFSNVKCESGKIVNDGTNEMLAFANIPGLNETLKSAGLDKVNNQLGISDDVTVEADVNNFDLGSIMVGMTNEIDLASELGEIGSVSELTDGIDQLMEADDQLIDGSKQLYDGTTQLKEQAAPLTGSSDQVRQLSSGAIQLNDGVKALQTGLTAYTNGVSALDAGVDQLYGIPQKTQLIQQKIDTNLVGGLENLTNNLNAIKMGINQKMETPDMEKLGKQLDSALVVINELDTIVQRDSGIINRMDTALQSVQSIIDNLPVLQKELETAETEVMQAQQKNMEAYDANEKTIAKVQGNLDEAKRQLKASIQSSIDALNTAKSALVASAVTTQQDENGNTVTVQGNVDTSAIDNQIKELNAQMASIDNIENVGDLTSFTDMTDSFKKLNATLKGLNDSVKTVSETVSKSKVAIKQLQEDVNTSKEDIGKLQAAMKDLDFKSLSSAKEEINGYMDGLIEGSKKLTAGAKALNGKLETLTEASKAGIDKTKAGTTQLTSNNATLNGGASALSDATGTLAGQSGTFNEMADGLDTLGKAFETLNDGAKQLYEGNEQFKSEGLDQLKEKVDLGVGELETLQSVMNEIKAMNKEYASYSGAPEGATVTSRYVFRTKEESSK
jgi:putative membrane protein